MPEVEPDHLMHAIRFALGRVRFPVQKRFLEEAERDRLARAVADHLKRCGWRVTFEQAPWHSAE